MIDNREPDWVQKLKFGDAPVTIQRMEVGDIQAVTTDGAMLVIERKTPDDFFNSLTDERLFVQMTRMSEMTMGSKFNNETGTWSYLIITGSLTPSPSGNVISQGRGITGWSWAALQGALLTIQEMGIFVVMCNGDNDYGPCVERIGHRNRSSEMLIMPPRPPKTLGGGYALLAMLPGIGTQRVMEVMKWAGGNAAHALLGLTNLEIDSPIGVGYRRKIRTALGLRPAEELALWTNKFGDETLTILEEQKENK